MMLRPQTNGHCRSRPKYRSLSKNNRHLTQQNELYDRNQHSSEQRAKSKEGSVNRHSSQIAFRRRVKNNVLKEMKNNQTQKDNDGIPINRWNAQQILKNRNCTLNSNKQEKSKTRKSAFWTKNVPGAQPIKISQSKINNKQNKVETTNYQILQPQQFHEQISPQNKTLISYSIENVANQQNFIKYNVSNSIKQLDSKMSLIKKYQQQLFKQAEIVCLKGQLNSKLEYCLNYFYSFNKALQMINKSLLGSKMLPNLQKVIDSHIQSTSQLVNKIINTQRQFMEHNHNEELIQKNYLLKKKNQKLENQLIQKQNKINQLNQQIKSLTYAYQKNTKQKTQYKYIPLRQLQSTRLFEYIRKNHIFQLNSSEKHLDKVYIDNLYSKIIQQVLNIEQFQIQFSKWNSKQKPKQFNSRLKKSQFSNNRSLIGKKQRINLRVSKQALGSKNVSQTNSHHQNSVSIMESIEQSKGIGDSKLNFTQSTHNFSINSLRVKIISSLVPQIFGFNSGIKSKQENFKILQKIYSINNEAKQQRKQRKEQQYSNIELFLNEILVTPIKIDSRFNQYDDLLVQKISLTMYQQLGKDKINSKNSIIKNQEVKLIELYATLEQFSIISNTCSRRKIISSILQRTKTSKNQFISQKVLQKIFYERSSRRKFSQQNNQQIENIELSFYKGQNKKHSLIHNKRFINCMNLYESKKNCWLNFNQQNQQKPVMDNTRKIQACRSQTVISLMNKWVGTQSSCPNYQKIQPNQEKIFHKHSIQSKKQNCFFNQNNHIQSQIQIQALSTYVSISQCILAIYFFVKEQFIWLVKALCSQKNFINYRYFEKECLRIQIIQTLKHYINQQFFSIYLLQNRKILQIESHDIVCMAWLTNNTCQLIKAQQQQLRINAIGKIVEQIKKMMLKSQ